MPIDNVRVSWSIFFEPINCWKNNNYCTKVFVYVLGEYFSRIRQARVYCKVQESKASLPSYLLYLARGYECGGGGTGVLGQVFGQHLTLHCWSAVSDRSSPDCWVMTTFHLSRCTCVTLYNCHLAHPPLPQHYSDMLYDWDSRHALMYIGIIIIIIHFYTYSVFKVLFDSFGNGH